MPKLPNELDLDYKKRVLDTKSASFCGAKWYNATIWLGSGMTTSCHHPLPHFVPVENVINNYKSLHNTDQKKQERAMMQRGERPAGCEYCWKIEDMGRDAISDRVYKSVIYSDGDLDYAYRNNQKTKDAKSAYRSSQEASSQEASSQEDFDPQTLEISFDRTCQFACSYCNPAFSTAWARDIKRNGGYTNLISDGRNHFTHPHNSSQLFQVNETNPYVEAFFKWWDADLHRTLKELRITGGEPLMSGYTKRLLNWFKANRGQSHTRLAINSNLGFEQSILEDLLDSCQDITLDIYTSNESMIGHAEYIRDGLNWHQWRSNLEFLAQSGKLRGLHMMCTVNALCLESLPEFLDFLVEIKQRYGRDFPSFTLNILRFPSFQSPLVLPTEIKQRHIQRLSDWLVKHNGYNYLHEHEIAHVTRLIHYLNDVDKPHSDSFELPKLHHDFYHFYRQYDQRRDKNFVETFPKLRDWYESLQV